ncbi:MAG TPA: asparagine synthase (glutamine-hydrolyzing) [Crocinitomicaceae bacterium]|nr:asparagine synthase (glutamine-hydrolyzing) [Crocinitomicaceae bacterium]
MCGISGYIDFNKTSTRENLVNMTDILSHRGPDGADYEVFQQEKAIVGLGHRRLSIIDLSENAKQPMHYNNLVLCFNGEIYNYEEIKADLSKLGHSFSMNSDSEMILHAYEEWGEKCIDRFIGMFAFTIFNEVENTVFCVRDRTGVKPFFYYLKDGLFLFSSELKSFHEHPKFSKEIDIDAVASYMQYGNVPTPHCIFQHCKKINAGHYFTIDLNNAPKNIKDIQQDQYWNVYDFYNAPKLDLNYNEAKVQTEELLQSAFNYRMVADVPVGVFLSGGYDSACVTALLQKNRTEKLKTFTIGVPDIGLNEAPYAKDVANHLGTDHTEINCTEKEAIDMIPDLPFFFDEPFADSSAIPTTLVSKMAREKVTVALSADGGDEIFAGYNRYDYMMRYGKRLNAIPSFARKSMVGIMKKVSSEKIPLLKNKYNFHNRYEKMKNVLYNPSNENIMLSLSQQFTNYQMKEFMASDFTELPTSYLSKELKSSYSPLSYMQAIDYQTYLLDDILQKVDRATMTHSLEGREPFLDHRIIEFAAKLPNDFKYHEGVKKRIIRDIVHQYVPKEMMDRPKMGFAIPIANWLNNELKDLVEEYISESKIKDQGIFNWEYIEKIKTAFFNGKKEYDTKIWYVLMFQMWYERWCK